MPCGCGKGRTASVLPATHEPMTTKKTTQVAVYEVKVGGETVLSTSSPTAAREEAKRLGGSLRVTSRPLEAADPVPV